MTEEVSPRFLIRILLVQAPIPCHVWPTRAPRSSPAPSPAPSPSPTPSPLLCQLGILQVVKDANVTKCVHMVDEGSYTTILRFSDSVHFHPTRAQQPTRGDREKPQAPDPEVLYVGTSLRQVEDGELHHGEVHREFPAPPPTPPFPPRPSIESPSLITCPAKAWHRAS
jgi:hypothetical protein